jgi:uncharacterized protein YjbI with pentapeptide repeats
LLRFSGPLIVLGIVGWINGIGAWPAFRQQDTSLLHWNLASNSEALKGLSQDIRSEGADWGNDLRHHLRNYLTLENMNLSGLDLSSSDLSDMSLENVSLAGTRLVNADFSCTDLSGVDFSGAKLMNSRFDYSNCSGHTSTIGSKCSKNAQNIINEEFMAGKWPFHPRNLNGRKFTNYTCLEATFVGADFSKAQIRGDGGRRSLGYDKKCNQLLVLVGNMSGAVFNAANLTCVALIHQPESPVPAFLAYPNKGQANSSEQLPSTKSPALFSFNGISFTGARLDRVSLLKGPFRFSQFERAQLMGLFLNIGVNKADLDYSRFNEINCEATAMVDTENSKGQPKYWPCLLVRRGTSDPNEPLHLNLLWSTLVTNLKPIGDDSFLCTPKDDLAAWVEGKRVDNAGFWLTPGMGPEPEKIPLKQLDCPAANYPEPNNSFYPEANRRWHHVLSSSQSDSKSPSKAVK